MTIKWEPPSEEELAARGIFPDGAPERARLADGKFKGDDPATPDVNEAWVKPTRKASAKKKV